MRAVLFLTMIMRRMRPRYQDRSYRYGLLEAGHVGENAYLAATAMGLGACGVGAFMDDAINAMLGVDGVEEAAVACSPSATAATWRSRHAARGSRRSESARRPLRPPGSGGSAVFVGRRCRARARARGLAPGRAPGRPSRRRRARRTAARTSAGARPVAGQVLEEVLPRAGSEEQDIRPDRGRPRVARPGRRRPSSPDRPTGRAGSGPCRRSPRCRHR